MLETDSDVYVVTGENKKGKYFVIGYCVKDHKKSFEKELIKKGYSEIAFVLVPRCTILSCNFEKEHLKLMSKLKNSLGDKNGA